ncbi:MAG: hypothetical protein C0399_00100 [Syntrophus sp. (in: bacteria)]|nr:hypothetical protein [Syntrophus sp. (in: bacteria)]
MKIEEALYRIISFNNVELSKKATTISPEQILNVDSYTISEALGRVEQEVFQVLKNITRDLTDSIVKYETDNEDTITTGNAKIDILKLAEPPMPQSDILVLLISKKGEALENPLEIFVAYKTDEPVAGGVVYQETAKNGFIDAVVENAKKYIGISTGSALVSIKGGKGNIASEDEIGFVVKFPYLAHAQFEGQVLRSMVAQTGEKGDLSQSLPLVASDVVDVAQVEGTWIEGKAIDGQKLLALYRSVGNDKEFFEKLSTFAGGMEKDTAQEGATRSFPVDSLHAIVIHIDPTKDNNKMAPVSPNGLSAQGFQGEPASGTAFGGQEITKSPITNSPITNNSFLPVDNDVILKRLELFVDRVNALLDGDSAVDEVTIDALAGGEPELISEKLHLLRLQTRDAGIGPVVQAAVKKIIFEYEEFQKAQMIGLSIEKNNLLRLDMPTLEGAISSNREETLNTIKGLGSSLYERINYFVHPYAGIYADDKQILQLRASQKDEGALLLDKQLNKEQGGLEKRLNELQLLIERSTLLKQWFTEDNAVQVEDNT